MVDEGRGVCVDVSVQHLNLFEHDGELVTHESKERDVSRGLDVAPLQHRRRDFTARRCCERPQVAADTRLGRSCVR